MVVLVPQPIHCFARTNLKAILSLKAILEILPLTLASTFTSLSDRTFPVPLMLSAPTGNLASTLLWLLPSLVDVLPNNQTQHPASVLSLPSEPPCSLWIWCFLLPFHPEAPSLPGTADTELSRCPPASLTWSSCPFSAPPPTSLPGASSELPHSCSLFTSGLRPSSTAKATNPPPQFTITFLPITGPHLHAPVKTANVWGAFIPGVCQVLS